MSGNTSLTSRGLSDLPPEIILEICSAVRPWISGIDTLKDDHLTAQTNEIEQDQICLHSLINFSYTCKKYHHLATKYIYQSLFFKQKCACLGRSATPYLSTPSGRRGEKGFDKIFSSLHSLRQNQRARTFVRQLYISTIPSWIDYTDCLPSEAALIIATAASAGIDVKGVLAQWAMSPILYLRKARDLFRHRGTFGRTFGMAVMILIIILELRAVTHVTLQASEPILTSMGQILLAMTPGRFRALPLQSFAIRTTRCQNRKCLMAHLHLAEMPPQLSTLFEMSPGRHREMLIDGIELESQFLIGGMPNVTSLLLNDVKVSREHLSQILRGPRVLREFMYSPLEEDYERATAPGPGYIMELLEAHHADSLQKLRLGRQDFDGPYSLQDGTVGSLARFSALDSLWIHESNFTHSIDEDPLGAQAEAQVKSFLRALPVSLKRLRLDGRYLAILMGARDQTYQTKSLSGVTLAVPDCLKSSEGALLVPKETMFDFEWRGLPILKLEEAEDGWRLIWAQDNGPRVVW